MSAIGEIYGPYSIFAYVFSSIVLFIRGKKQRLASGEFAYTSSELFFLLAVSYGILIASQAVVNLIAFSNGFNSFLQIMCTSPINNSPVFLFWIYYSTIVGTVFLWFAFGNAATIFSKYSSLLFLPSDANTIKPLLLCISVSTGLFWPLMSYFGYFDYFCT